MSLAYHSLLIWDPGRWDHGKTSPVPIVVLTVQSGRLRLGITTGYRQPLAHGNHSWHPADSSSRSPVARCRTYSKCWGCKGCKRMSQPRATREGGETESLGSLLESLLASPSLPASSSSLPSVLLQPDSSSTKAHGKQTLSRARGLCTLLRRRLVRVYGSASSNDTARQSRTRNFLQHFVRGASGAFFRCACDVRALAMFPDEGLKGRVTIVASAVEAYL